VMLRSLWFVLAEGFTLWFDGLRGRHEGHA
jgi:hypothetical protein